MRVLITGSAGFIGSHLSRELQDAGHPIDGMDIVDGWGKDARLLENVRTAIKGHGAEVLVHLAAKDQGSRDHILGDPMIEVQESAGMTAVVAQACRGLGVRLIVASSSEIYGNRASVACDEEKGPFAVPGSLFAVNKLFGEALGRFYAPKGFTVLRLANPYGPGLPISSEIINLLWRAKYGMPMPVTLGAKRSWCWIGDTVRAMRLAIEKGDGAYNIGRDDDDASMQDLAEMACNLTGADSGLIEVAGAPTTPCGLISTAKIRRLGWEPQVSLYEGMRRTLESWVQHMDEHGVLPVPVPHLVAK